MKFHVGDRRILDHQTALWALLPLVTREQLKQGPEGYGILLGAFGVGAVLAATVMPVVRRVLTTEQLVAAATVVFAALVAGVGLLSSFRGWPD